MSPENKQDVTALLVVLVAIVVNERYLKLI
jgi:hypothetical protein